MLKGKLIIKKQEEDGNYKFAGVKSYMTCGFKNTFGDDAEIAEYAKEAVYWLRANNLIDGVGNNMFAPKEPVTRAMAAKLIASVLSFENGEVK